MREEDKMPDDVALSTHSLEHGFWTADRVALAASGTWLRPPAENWAATGVSIYAPAMQPGNIAVVRTELDKCGMPEDAVRQMHSLPACIMTTAPELLDNVNLPVIQVADATEAVLGMGRYARDRMNGQIIGVTGSAGKTTCVAMLTEALTPWGPVRQSAHNANLPRGVAWNLASMPWDTPYIVLEMAIGRMAVSSRMARPHVAIFTNIQPAHLGETDTLRDIAVTKSAIFLGMAEGSIAILNRDMQEWDTVYQAALKRKLTVVTYGEHADCDVQLLEYESKLQRVKVRAKDSVLEYTLGAGGKHIALNSLAVLATLDALNLPCGPALVKLSQFRALAGRGEEKALRVKGRQITVIDDAYNANPGSMKAALERVSEIESAGRRIAVLGEMAELGGHSERYHTELAVILNQSHIDRVFMVGEAYQQCWNALLPEKKGALVVIHTELRPLLIRQIEEGDVVLFKGSHSTRIHDLVRWIKAIADSEPLL